jgi:hypothetical protein
MTTAEAREMIGLFAYIEANGDLYPKCIYGRITDVDRTSIWFEDNYGQPYRFKFKNIRNFELVPFKVPDEIPEY